LAALDLRRGVKAAIQLSQHPEMSSCAVYWEVDGLDIGAWHGWRFVLLHHTVR